MQTRLNKGFTLIELLVVIAIIGILSGIVLVASDKTKQEANDAKVKSQLSSIRSAAEIYYDNHKNYGTTTENTVATACNESMFTDTTSGLKDLVDENRYPTGTSLTCYSSKKAWAVSANLAGDSNYWCVDSTGASRVATSSVLGTACL